MMNKYARKTKSGKYTSDGYISDDTSEALKYHVQVPETPDNQPMADNSITARVEEQYVSSSIFTGGFNSLTRAHLMDKVTDSETTHPQMAGAKGHVCQVEGCDSRVMRDERGHDILPCECGFKICIDCFKDTARYGDGTCPGCKELYNTVDVDEMHLVADRGDSPLPLMASQPSPASVVVPIESRTMSMTRSPRTNNRGDFDNNKWLFETKGTYGYGNVIWPSGSPSGEGGTGTSRSRQPEELQKKPWRPLTRKIKIRQAIISPYRLFIALRLVALGLFLMWRVRNENDDAIWLWGMSVVCEIWFSFTWLLDQLPKLSPTNRTTDLSVLKDKFETPTAQNPTGKSDLPATDQTWSSIKCYKCQEMGHKANNCPKKGANRLCEGIREEEFIYNSDDSNESIEEYAPDEGSSLSCLIHRSCHTTTPKVIDKVQRTNLFRTKGTVKGNLSDNH